MKREWRILLLGFLWLCLPLQEAQADQLQRAYQTLYKGQWAQAYQMYQALVQQHARNPALHVLKGHLLYTRGQFMQAIRSYQSGLQALPTVHHAWLHNNIGNAYFRLRRYKQAIAHYTQALQRNPRYERARYNLELALRKQKKQKQKSQPPPPPPRSKKKRRQRRKRRPPRRKKRQPPRKKRLKAPPPKDFRLDEYDRFIPYSYIRRLKPKTSK